MFNKLFEFDEITYEETKKKFKIYGAQYEFLIGIYLITTPKSMVVNFLTSIIYSTLVE